MGGQLDMIVCSVGTGGTSNGLGKRLKEIIPGLKMVGVTPAPGVKIQGIRNPREPHPSQWVDRSVFDEFIELDEKGKKEAFSTGLKAARSEGLLLGMSSACALDIAIRKSAILGEGKKILAIFPDSGYKYLSSPDYLGDE
jgi:cysteine synthase